jgi:hypothetical protein
LVQNEKANSYLIPRYALSVTAFICGILLILMAVIGPLGLDILKYRTSQSGIIQLMGQDLADLILIAPLLFIGGILLLMKKDGAKYLLILTPITLMYLGLSIGIGQEWGNPAYTGNVENFFWIYLTLIIGGLILLLGSLPIFSSEDSPNFKSRNLKIYAVLLILFLLLFAFMWIGQVIEVLKTGSVAGGGYTEAPVLFWTIKYLDLGVTIPLGFLSAFLLVSNLRKAYAIILLFFGFFITTGTAVNTMLAIQIAKGDVQLASGSVVIFPVLGILVYAFFFYLVKDKLPWSRKEGTHQKQG